MNRLFVLGCTVVMLLAGCGKESEADKASARVAAKDAPLVIRIGHAGQLTGPQAHLGKDNEHGVELAIEALNAEHRTLGGKPVRFEMISEDDAASPQQATVVAQRLVDADVAGVVGHWNSGTTIPASAIYAKAGIAQISPSATNPAYTHQGFKTAFRDIANDTIQSQALGRFASETLGAKRIVLIDDRSAASQGQVDEFERTVKTQGATIVAHEYTNDHAVDFRGILTGIKKLTPDLVFYAGMDAQAGPLLKQMHGLGIKTPLLGADGMRTPALISLAGPEVAEGTYASSPGAQKENLPDYADFERRFRARFNTPIQLYAPNSYDATMMLANAMQAAGSAKPADYLPKLAQTDYTGVTGRIRFDPLGDLRNSAITVYQVQGGVWHPVKTFHGADAN
ncbi:branched-chain amino acid ABC transporter substrate-binding protein [Paraburkholderia hayleyella]|uniref:branched-chain amino acid ABC transporter substrate-binding protein n=1 Tax=Paraburkholderia hayleyella TaxID=2152889 RepID=UPI001291ABA9|nr:branched-chain amino acid ABC transporter substrate-binding protein [Paraburkholderia hayleyella]